MAATAVDMTAPRPHSSGQVYAVYGHLDPTVLTLDEAFARGLSWHQIPTDALMALDTGHPTLVRAAMQRLDRHDEPLIGAVGFDDWCNTALSVLNPDWALAPARTLVTDKPSLYARLREHEAQVAQSLVGAVSTVFLREAIDALGPRPILKPATGAGSRGVYRYRDDLDLDANLALYQQILRHGHIDSRTPIIAAAYLGDDDAAREISVDLVIHDHAMRAATVHEKRTATAVHPFVDNLMISPPTDHVITAALDQLPMVLSRTAAAIDVPAGVLHIELRLHHGRWHVLDVGVRPGMGLVAHSAHARTGIDPRLAHLAASIGTRLDPTALRSAQGAHAATAIMCCYVADPHRRRVRLDRYSELATRLREAEAVIGWHLNVAEVTDPMYRPDAGLSVGLGAPDTATALTRLRSLLDPYQLTTDTDSTTESVVAQ
ncbi:ATP-grasp domain-containing protein [Nocardia takedensis]|uniref:ATP-grasp domain-containing protein n=1 Tax=Nocardia takedensis TaxID=259390 RepID=UPI0002FB70DB|nr:ATP-grasp domain-containing protein [Nocardia takedensis]